MRFRSDIHEEAERTYRMRELLRGNGYQPMPSGSEGFVVQDLDLVLAWHGQRFGLDRPGRVRLTEMRRWGKRLDGSKVWTFGLLDTMLRQSPWADARYDGFYVVEHSDDRFDRSTRYRVEGAELDSDEFLSWVESPVSPIPAHGWRESAFAPDGA